MLAVWGYSCLPRHRWVPSNDLGVCGVPLFGSIEILFEGSGGEVSGTITISEKRNRKASTKPLQSLYKASTKPLQSLPPSLLFSGLFLTPYASPYLSHLDRCPSGLQHARYRQSVCILRKPPYGGLSLLNLTVDYTGLSTGAGISTHCQHVAR